MAATQVLEACVQTLLCGLSGAVRGALIGILNTYVGQLEVFVNALKAELAILNILTAPVALADKAVQAVITEAKAGANLIPFGLIGTCTGIGNLNVSIQANLDLILADANVIANDLERLLSFGDELSEKISELEAVITYYLQVIATINVCPDLFA